MKITIFIGGISGGGAERVACNLANHLSCDGNEVTLLTMSETQNTYHVCADVKLVSLLKEEERRNKIRDNLIRYKRLKKYTSTVAADAFVVMLPVTICLLLHFRKNISGKIIASERNDPKSNSTLIQKLLRKYGKRADAWVFQTENAATWYEGIAQKSIVIPNAINPAFIREPYVGEKEKVIVAAGRLSGQKNFRLLIDAFSAISTEFSEYRIEIFGKGPLEGELRNYTLEKGVSEKVEFMGYVDDMPERLEKASAFVLSSDFEGMPNALMEAMALGVPCISTDCPCGGPGFLIKNGENGLLVPVGDAEKMADAMRRLLSSPEEAEAMGNCARRIVRELEPEKIYGKWEAFINNIVKE